ncbi:hypothetical protein BpHYR1_048719 [Brachionus plicatilis]|uniref:Uncharacterized protein n=1 Tax=Brachionus plicatilis TaxID=10195 RepID=A0A3M7R8W4_BRAPC|nr:hypothetical protein BpHYR1_048719 [Brachionus plicatilis]
MAQKKRKQNKIIIPSNSTILYGRQQPIIRYLKMKKLMVSGNRRRKVFVILGRLNFCTPYMSLDRIFCNDK